MSLNVLLKLSPFFISSSVFLFKYPIKSRIDSTYILFKCIPILSLALFVLLSLKNNNNKSYLKRIIFGLILSSIADAVICFEEYFLIAVGMFAIVQINYLTSFGFKPLRLDIALAIIFVEICCCFYLIPFINIYMFKFILPGYVTLLFAMIWRSLSRVKFYENFYDWPNLFGAIGSILFGCSDLILCYNAYAQQLVYSNIYIMITYYYAQAGIALSVLNRNSFKKTSNQI